MGLFTPLPLPAAVGNALISDGVKWTSQALPPSYAGNKTEIFTSSGSWTPPTGITNAQFIVIGGGGGGGGVSAAGTGGLGGFAHAQCTGLSGSITITVGAGGSATDGNGNSGGTSSVIGTGVSISATGGAGQTGTTQAASGSGTITTGTAIRTNANSGRLPWMAQANDLRPNGLGQAATAYTAAGSYSAGGMGRGSSIIGNSSGGVGGAVLVIY